MLGQTISHYRIVSQLGVGGMGIVYEAVDPRLGRQVAIKFVPEELSHDLKALERLRAEARTVSGLNHPNICTIYDVGEHDGRPFFVMELLKGQTLRDRISTKGLKIHEAVEIGIQVADALDCAHSQRVIHRDIKPANLFMVERGQVKVLDFGLAKLLSRDLGTQMTLAPTIDQTAAGVAMGTVAYMSPEQVQGEDLDGRTDLFSLGVVLYEAVTGHQPFTGKTSAVVLSAILTQAPTPPIALNPTLPARLQDVIHNCLEKDRELRYQEAASLRAELKRVKRDIESGATSVATGPVAIAGGAAKGSGARTTVRVPIVSDSAATGAVTTATAASSGPVSGGQPSSIRNPWVVFGLVTAALGVGASIYLSRGEETPVAPPSVAATPAPAAPVASAPAPAAAPVTPPGQAEATNAANARLDEAIAEANRLRAEVEAERRLVAERARSAQSARPPQAAPSRPATETRGQMPSTATPALAPEPSPAPPPPAVISTPPAPVPAARAPEPAPTAPAPRVEAAPERRAAPPAEPAEDDETAIRRVLATYTKALETKDLALFRSVKPNLSPEEQRRLEDGFRAVTSQRVTLTIDAVDRRGQDAVVRIRRHDVIQAGGRQQTADSQQTMTFTRANGAWVIREIGR